MRGLKPVIMVMCTVYWTTCPALGRKLHLNNPCYTCRMCVCMIINGSKINSIQPWTPVVNIYRSIIPLLVFNFISFLFFKGIKIPLK